MRRTVSKAKELSFLCDRKFRGTFFCIAKKWQDFHRFVRQIFLTCHVPYDTLKLYIYSLR